MPPKAAGGKSKQGQAKKAMQKAGASKSKKKWSQESAKTSKTAAAVLLDAQGLEKLKTSIPSMKNITTASVADRLGCNLSLAKRVIRKLHAEGKIKEVHKNGNFLLYTRIAGKETDAAIVEEAKTVKAQKGKKGK
ncbi:putative small subunit ribosomal protein S25e [Blattamonas nauphoetae]|uniref:40S ribosomal protein S25 n=1 Tax=Blattamonas nauphoetae TaxID=2049346 RepID=A0ABQ9YCF2_9EUKA|nr:putative small subunit ribosomal protein S25e [Blattamonas nauphoetae]